MATKGFQDIYVKHKRLRRSLVYSLEQAKDKETTPTVMSKKVNEIKGSQIGAFVAGNGNRLVQMP